VDRQLHADLLRDVLLLAAAARLFELLEQILDFPVVRLEQRDRILFCFGHELSPSSDAVTCLGAFRSAGRTCCKSLSCRL